ncbi:unnamed protein product [Brassica rapa subsp. narinosa]
MSLHYTLSSRLNAKSCPKSDAVCQAILQAMDAPLICTSAKWPQENEWMTDPTAIGNTYLPLYKQLSHSASLTKRNLSVSVSFLQGLDFVVDGVRVAELPTIVDMTGSYDSYPKVIREGKVK